MELSQLLFAISPSIGNNYSSSMLVGGCLCCLFCASGPGGLALFDGTSPGKKDAER